MIKMKLKENNNESASPRSDAIAIPETSPRFPGNGKGGKFLALIVTAQVAAIFSFAVPYAQTLAFGKTVTLQCHTYDPRDIFKGDYVAINYDVCGKGSLQSFEAGDTAYMKLKRHSPFWELVSTSKTRPQSLKEDEAVMRVFVKNKYTAMTGIEKYYIPEGSGKEINFQGLTAEVALSNEGMPVFKRLLSDGKDVAKLTGK